MTARNGPALAESQRDFFSLQLHFAEVLAAKGLRPLAQTLTWSTNLHRRFAYGHLAHQTPDAEFTTFAEHVARLPGHAPRLATIIAAFAERPLLQAPSNTRE